jgi:hypothetical protein
MKCPDCGSHDVYPSKSGNRGLGIIRWCVVTMRCHCCYRKFLSLGLAFRRHAEVPEAPLVKVRRTA